MVAGPEGVVVQLRAVLTSPPPLNGHSSAADRDRPSGGQAPGRDRGDPSEPRAIEGAPIPHRRCPRAPWIAFLRAALKSGAIRARACWMKRSRPACAACADARTSARRAMGRLVLPRQPKSNGVVTWPARARPGSPTKPLRRYPVTRNWRGDGQGRLRHLGFS
jgi:hypothetical protein